MSDRLWTPKNPDHTRMAAFMRFVSDKKGKKFQDYQALHRWSIQEPALFWSHLCDFFHLQFDTPPTSILNDYKNIWEARWFTGAYFNFAEKLLQRRDGHPAIISVNEDGSRQQLSYADLYQEVAACAAGLREAGVTVGDRVAAVLPNTAQTIIAMLATSSLGAIWSSCSPDFGTEALLDRLGQLSPKILFIADGHFYAGKKHSAAEKIASLYQALPSLECMVICPHIDIKIPSLPKLQYWQAFVKTATTCQFVSLPFEHPLYILFSSGTTGKPKCIVHGAGGTLIQHLKELGLHSNLDRDDRFCFYTTCGWMMWNWSVSSLALGLTLVLYEGSPTHPSPLRMFQLIEEEELTVFGTGAKFISAVEKTNCFPNQHYTLATLRTILSTGSPLLPSNYDFVYQHIKKEVQLSSISGGTDIVSCFALGNPMLPVYRGELQCLGLGMAVSIFDETGHPVLEQRGELVCTAAAPSMPIGFYNDPQHLAYQKAYFERFPGVWTHGDYAEITPHHGLIIYGRSDTVLNPGGVRIGTAEIYRQVERIDEIVDSVVIGQDWQGDVRIVLFVKLQEGHHLSEHLIQHIKDSIRQHASPRHVPAKILQVPDIPRTINGKTLELTVKQVVHHLPISNRQAIANPESLTYFENHEALS
jgi:acetoacetyl-CoA synthetase